MKIKQDINNLRKLNNLNLDEFFPWIVTSLKKYYTFEKLLYYSFQAKEQVFRLSFQYNRSLEGDDYYLYDELFIEEESDIFSKIYQKRKRAVIRKSNANVFINLLFQNYEISSLFIYPIIANKQVIGLILLTFPKEYKLNLQTLNLMSLFFEQITSVLQNIELKKQFKIEKDKSNSLLINILPSDIAHELEEHGFVEPVKYDSLSILFTDFVGFSKITKDLTPEELVNMLDGYFFYFDDIIKNYNIERLKTIGDSYMCVGGLKNEESKIHAIKICLAALEFCNFTKTMMDVTKLQHESLTWDIRVGINTGPAIAGVIGKTKFAFDIWGDSVNIASRMEAGSRPGKINISSFTYDLVKDYFETEYRGEIEVKNGQKYDMYFLHCLKQEYSDQDGIFANEKLLKAIDLFDEGVE